MDEIQPKLSTSFTSSENSKIKAIILERKGFLFGLGAQFMWAVCAICIKYGSKCNSFSPNAHSFLRSVSMTIFSYIAFKYENIPFTPFSAFKRKGWFLTRMFGIYLCFLFYIISLKYIRASTTTCLDNCTPLVIIIISVCFLGDPFYNRYIIGVIICFFGSLLMILNEKTETTSTTTSDTSSNGNIVIGVIAGIINVIFYALITVAQKLMVDDGLNTAVQLVYIGISNSILAFGVCILEWNFGLNLYLIFYASLNGLAYYYAQALTDKALKNMDVSKFSTITYTLIIFVFILGFLFCGEKIYFSDIIGSLMIVGFQIYNVYYPNIEVK